MTEKFTIFCDFQAANQSQQSGLASSSNQTNPVHANLKQINGISGILADSSHPTGGHEGGLTLKQQPLNITTSTSQSSNQQQILSGKIYTQLQASSNNIVTTNNYNPNFPNQHPKQVQNHQHPSKREPLGLRQTSEQQQAATRLAAVAPNAVEDPSSQSSQGSSIQSHHQNITRRQVDHNQSTSEEDQENDISMASLGSDFVPTFGQADMNMYNDHSFELDDGASSLVTSNSDAHYLSGPMDSELTDADLLIEDTEMLDDEEDARRQVEYDEELKKELTESFRRHDDSQLFKSAVYINEIYDYMRRLEKTPELRPLPNYIDFQEDIDSQKRSILINWLVEVADEYELQTETLFICINIIDRFLSEMSITTSNLQLLGVAAMFSASKYEEIYPPNLYQFVEITDDCYTGEQIRHMEQVILKALHFRISMPTTNFFLRQIFAYNKFPKKVYDLAEYLCYLTLTIDQPFLEYLPSEIAIASVILAAHELGVVEKISPQLSESYEKSNSDQLARRKLPEGVELRDIDRRNYTINGRLPFCIESLRTMQERVFNKSFELPNEPTIINRFKTEAFNYVALIDPPQFDELFAEI